MSASFLPALALLSFGFSKRYMQLLIATSVIQSISFVAGASFGIIGISVAYTVSSFLVLIPMTIMSFKGTSVNARLFFMTILWPMLSAVAAGAVAYALIQVLSQESIINHLITALLFFIIYTGLTMLRRESRETLRSIWASVISRRKGEAEKENLNRKDG